MEKIKIVMACDHGGYELKEYLRQHLEELNQNIIDVGCYGTESVDYPDFAEKGAAYILSGECKFGIFICGTGIGISMAANKINGIRAALCTNEFMAKATRAHNNANVLCLGGRVVGQELALAICKAFLKVSFDGGRHENRVNKLAEIEKKQFAGTVGEIKKIKKGIFKNGKSHSNGSSANHPQNNAYKAEGNKKQRLPRTR